ncbi:MAG: hypothetical protein KAY37_01245 [Phycisphaerae bacterium]|nr:hypothetical protein [Phycisphaerae bacterium]
MRIPLAILLLAGFFVGSAMGQSGWYVKGDFNGWGTDDEMNDDGDGTYSLPIDMSAQPVGETFDWKISNFDWSESYPPGNVRGRYIAGEITFHFLPGVAGDGWNPPENRVGWSSYTDWDIAGDWTNWGDNAILMFDAGDGLYQVDSLLPTAGLHEFKFRAAGDWEINVGQDFRFNGPNATIEPWSDNEWHRLELDVPNGRWQTYYLTPACPGDSNCDGAIDWRDIDYFVAAMNDNYVAWGDMFAPGDPACPFVNNDVSGDGTVNWRDIDPLVAIMNTTCP